MATPRPPITRSGRCTTAASAIIDHPSAQIVWPTYVPAGRTSNEMSARTTVSSRKISHTPRLTRNQRSSVGVAPRARRRYAPVPARKKNTGAQ
jgi:hypothetical protein